MIRTPIAGNAILNVSANVECYQACTAARRLPIDAQAYRQRRGVDPKKGAAEVLAHLRDVLAQLQVRERRLTARRMPLCAPFRLLRREALEQRSSIREICDGPDERGAGLREAMAAAISLRVSRSTARTDGCQQNFLRVRAKSFGRGAGTRHG